jgi:hypothetical protein
MWLESMSKERAVSSSKRMRIAFASGSTSTSETVFPLNLVEQLEARTRKPKSPGQKLGLFAFISAGAMVISAPSLEGLSPNELH